MKRTLLLAALFLSTMAAEAQALRPGTLPRQWRAAGPKCTEVPDFEVREYNEDFIILRQSGCTHAEKPFLFLLFGETRALLLDSGAGHVDVAGAVQSLRAAHAARRGGPVLPLLVAHSHAHGDHTAGDADLAKLPGVKVVGTTVADVVAAFGLTNWPNVPATYDLGNRVLDIIPIPGHEPSSIAIYDRQTGVLLTGDTLYPGRLFVQDGAAFIDSIQRLVSFTATRPVAHILGTHIENSATPFVDYPVGTVYQPDEHVLELGRAHLLELREQLRPPLRTVVLRDFSILP